jgi:hypothetical protein
VVYAILKEGRPYQAPDPKQMHEMERAKLIRHHGKRLRELGADEELIGQIVAKLTTPPAACSSATEKQTPVEGPTPTIRRVSPAKVAAGPWDSGLAKQGHRYIRLSKNERPERLHRDGLHQNALNQQKAKN